MEKDRIVRQKEIGSNSRTEVTVGLKKTLHNEEPHNSFSSQNIVRMITSRTVRWFRHVAHIGGLRNTCEILVHLLVEDRGPNKRLLVWALKTQRKDVQAEPPIYFPISYLIIVVLFKF